MSGLKLRRVFTPDVAVTAKATKLSHVSASVSRQVSAASAQRKSSKYGPANETNNRLDFSGKSQASLTLQYMQG